ncbi:MAG: LysM peptidoglycan-binding domain-containing protein [Planctomycetota bacterium]
MKRSESVLVWSVAVIVGVIVLIAVVFGGDGSRKGALPDESASRRTDGALDLDKLVALDADPAGRAGKAADGEVSTPKSGDADGLGLNFRDIADRKDGDKGADAGAKPATDAPASGSSTSPRLADVRTLLGEFRLEGQPDGERYRVVTARYGDSFGALVQKWTGSMDREDEVRALNEGLVPERLRSGEEIWFPWVEDAVLLEAHDSRRGRLSGGPARPVEATANLGEAPVAAAGASDWYVIKPGETLWKLAAKAVGTRRATEYINEILRLNPTVTDPGRIREGDRILMPKR